MNVAIVAHNYDLGEGTGGYTAQILPRIAEEHDVTLYAAQVLAPIPPGVRWVRVPALRSRGYATILTFPAAFAAVRRRHDLVHAQGWVTSGADVVTAHYVLAAWRRIASAWDVPTPRGERWFGGYVERREARLYRRGCRIVIAPSHGVREDLARHYGRTDGVAVVPHGFQPPPTTLDPATARARWNLPSRDVVALWIGDARKGLRTAIDAVGGVHGVRLLVATHASPAPYLAGARRAGCPDRVHWAGYVNPPWPAYAAADILLYPTIYDPFGLVVAEAMSAGVAPIVTRAAGVAELLRHGSSGWLLDKPSVADTVAGLAALRDDPALLRRLREGARAAAARRTWDDVARETLVAYKDAARP